MKTYTILFLLTLGALAHAEVKLNALFADHAVLQRDRPIPIWGEAAVGEKITIKFAGTQTKTVADADGRWRVNLPALHASPESRELEVRGSNVITLHDVLVGDVWICSGQSNMERQLGLRSGQLPLDNWEQEVAAANYPLIRHFAVARTPSDTPQSDTAGHWDVCSPQTVAQFTAVGYFFARDLLKAGHAPIGLIHSSWGGTPAERWISREVIAADFPDVIAAQQKAVADYAPALEKYKNDEPALLKKWDEDSATAKAAGKPEPRKPAPPRDPSVLQNQPSVLYQGMIAPLQPYAIRGVIWYQGEANVSRSEQYRRLFPALIRDWRSRWGQGDFPFLFVQLAPYHGNSPELRDAQLYTWRTTPNTAMAVTTDVGNADNIHPTNKAPVGARLALAARALAYGEPVEYSGPRFTTMSVEGARAILHFDHIGGGFVAQGGVLRGFTISADGKTFVPATAEIAGDTVVASASIVTTPTAVRYGWASVPDVNLFNREELPATPFRTDEPPATGVTRK